MFAADIAAGVSGRVGPHGALVVFGLDGKIRQTIDNIDRPNNVDVEYGFSLGGETVDLAVLTERHKQRLRAFRIASDGSGVTELSSPQGSQVFEGEMQHRSRSAHSFRAVCWSP